MSLKNEYPEDLFMYHTMKQTFEFVDNSIGYAT